MIFFLFCQRIPGTRLSNRIFFFALSRKGFFFIACTSLNFGSQCVVGSPIDLEQRLSLATLGSPVKTPQRVLSLAIAVSIAAPFFFSFIYLFIYFYFGLVHFFCISHNLSLDFPPQRSFSDPPRRIPFRWGMF